MQTRNSLILEHARAVTLSAALLVALAACGGGSDAPASSDGGPVQASFGVAGPCLPPSGAPQPARLVHLYNYSGAIILEIGIRPCGSSAYLPADPGRGLGSTPVNGGIAWITLPAGAYEGFIQTDRGLIEFQGTVPLVQVPRPDPSTLPPGTPLPPPTFVAGPADLYLFELDLGDPNPGRRGGSES